MYLWVYCQLMSSIVLFVPSLFSFLSLLGEFAMYLNFCRSLRFEDKPDYPYLRKLFRGLYVYTNSECQTNRLFPPTLPPHQLSLDILKWGWIILHNCYAMRTLKWLILTNLLAALNHSPMKSVVCVRLCEKCFEMTTCMYVHPGIM